MTKSSRSPTARRSSRSRRASRTAAPADAGKLKFGSWRPSGSVRDHAWRVRCRRVQLERAPERLSRGRPGASAGRSRARLHARGATVVLTGRREELLEELRDEPGRARRGGAGRPRPSATRPARPRGGRRRGRRAGGQRGPAGERPGRGLRPRAEIDRSHRREPARPDPARPRACCRACSGARTRSCRADVVAVGEVVVGAILPGWATKFGLRRSAAGRREDSRTGSASRSCSRVRPPTRACSPTRAKLPRWVGRAPRAVATRSARHRARASRDRRGPARACALDSARAGKSRRSPRPASSAGWLGAHRRIGQDEYTW